MKKSNKKIMEMDKKLDAKMTVPQMKQDIKADKKALAEKQKKAKKGKK